jgi:hypothetical protein
MVMPSSRQKLWGRSPYGKHDLTSRSRDMVQISMSSYLLERNNIYRSNSLRLFNARSSNPKQESLSVSLV